MRPGHPLRRQGGLRRGHPPRPDHGLHVLPAGPPGAPVQAQRVAASNRPFRILVGASQHGNVKPHHVTPGSSNTAGICERRTSRPPASSRGTPCRGGRCKGCRYGGVPRASPLPPSRTTGSPRSRVAPLAERRPPYRPFQPPLPLAGLPHPSPSGSGSPSPEPGQVSGWPPVTPRTSPVT
jgi:hypothetical protein